MATHLGPDRPLPYSDAFESTDAYVDSLLNFIGTNDLLRTLCGGVHVLDFFTSDPDLYSRVLPQEWRDFFSGQEIMSILDLLMRDGLAQFYDEVHEGPPPPQSLIDYIQLVRKHCLDRKPRTSQCARNRAMKPTQKLARHVKVGMTVKKVHEVGLFASFIASLASSISASNSHEITHLVDFGSGQNYLGRALASEPYNRNLVAIESKSHNAERAKEYDVMARLVEKPKVMRNKKAYRAGLDRSEPVSVPKALPTPPPELEANEAIVHGEGSASLKIGSGTVQYVEHCIQNGKLTDVIDRISGTMPTDLMVVSLHSCGNLVHHGLRSLILNSEVKSVAMVGCCYNLITERLGPATYKLPDLRPMHPRVERAGEARDPNGFPMSDRLCQYAGKGVRLNITARMMAVQAPQNWGEKDSESFFTRHFYRALLQRVFLDRGIVGPPSAECVGGSPAGHSCGGTPIIIGSLRKTCYESFVAYVRGALAKLHNDDDLGTLIKEKMASITDAEIARYEENYKRRKKELSVIWSLMAFSAGVIEATIVVDRWLWLREQDEVKEAWVEPVFDYAVSPRNLVVVGIKK